MLDLFLYNMYMKIETIQKLIDDLNSEYEELANKIDVVLKSNIGEIDKEIEVQVISDCLERRRIELSTLEDIRDAPCRLEKIPEDYVYDGDILKLYHMTDDKKA